MNVVRKSNIELLRIVAMTMIVLHHFMMHGKLFLALENDSVFYLESVSIMGVDIFIMISGYFGIKLSLKSFTRLVIVIIAFSGFSLLLYYGFCGFTPFSIKNLLDWIKFPVTRSPYWFIQVYLALMIISPFLNRGIESMSLKQFGKVLLLILAFNFYSCAIGDNKVDLNGYGLFNFICCYLTGAFLHRLQIFSKESGKFAIVTRGNTGIWIALAVIVICTAVIIIFFNLYGLPANIGSLNFFYLRPFIYSSVLVFIPALCMLYLFSRLNIESKVINSIAACSLGVYLLQDGWFGPVQYQYIKDLIRFPLWERYAMLILMFVGLWAGAYLGFMILNFFLKRIGMAKNR